MTIGQVKGWFGLKAVGTPTREGVAGPVTIGQAAAMGSDAALATVDVAYRYEVTSAAPANVARLDLATGQVTQQTGEPVIVDEGIDFEGRTLPTTGKVQAVLIETGDGNTGTVAVASSIVGIPTGVLPKGSKLQALAGVNQPGVTGSDELDLTFSAAGDTATVTVLGSE